jgi:preprotein translocase SecE subunit
MIKFFKDAISEIHNVTWPTQKHYMHISMVAIVFTLSTAVFV